MKTWYNVYVDGNYEAGSNQLGSALTYAVQYATERSVKVQVKEGRKVLVTFSKHFGEDNGY